MNKAKLRRYHSMLQEQLSALQSNSSETVERLEDSTETHPDPNDRASAESERNFDLRLRDRDRKLIQKVQDALQRIEDGTFGICEECGEPIDDKRLTARPVTSQCIECKEEQERRERHERAPAEQPVALAEPAARRR
jgi:DnaK suppressor protein